MPRNVPRRPVLPGVLVQIAQAANHAARYDSRANRQGEARMLIELGHLAGVVVPARGVLAPVDEDLCREFHRIARNHLEYERASRRFRAGLRRVAKFEDRDAVETAHTELLSVTSVTYYYAGLAFGLTFATPPEGDASGALHPKAR